MLTKKITDRLLQAILKRKRHQLYFCINPGRSGSKFLAQVLATAERTVSLHEPMPQMIGEFLDMVTHSPYASSYSKRAVKAEVLRRQLIKLPFRYNYCETSNMFIKTFFDIVVNEFEDVQVIVLRRDMAHVLKSFIELGYLTDRNPDSFDWLVRPDAETAALQSIDTFEKMDPYDRCISHLLDIDARAQRFAETYPRVPIHPIRLEQLNFPDSASHFFERLGLTPTSNTFQLVGKKVNTRETRKEQINVQSSIDYCRERIDLYIEKALRAGIALPATLENYRRPIE